MAQNDKQQTIYVELRPGERVQVDGQTARMIAYLTKHSAFFNDKDTLGNFLLIAKGGDLQLKQDVTIQS